MIVPFKMSWQGVRVDFQMDLDPDIPADYAVMHYAQQGQPCEPEVCYVMWRALKDGDTAIDAGANVGFFTLLMSRLVGPTGKVLAFEPGENNLARLKTNLALNDCQNVQVIEQPLWASKAKVPFFAYRDGGFNSMWAQNPGDVSQVLETTMIDAEVHHKVRLIKLDIEGAELKALQGAKFALRNYPIIISELNEPALERAGASIEKLRDLLRSQDCFTLSTTGHFPTHIPRGVEMVVTRLNTNVMFAQLQQLKTMWPEVQL